MASKTVTGYKWNNENAAINAQNACNAHFLSGRPQGNPNGDGKPYTTTEYFTTEYNDGASGTFWYFIGNISPVLGNPTEFDIDYDDTI
jgi:hypothetical protein